MGPTYDDVKTLAEDNVCALCRGDLSIRTNSETNQFEVYCPQHPDQPYVGRPTAIQAFRRGESVPAHIEQSIRGAMLPGGHEKLTTAIALLKMRFPLASLDEPSAALFIMDCMRLDLDPLLGEIVPVTFKVEDKSTGQRHKIVQPVIAEDGWLSMAARGCKDRWAGPPNTCRIEDYLHTLEENKGKPPEEIQKLARAMKRDICGDEQAHLWVAWGKVRIDGAVMETSPTYGWYKGSEKGPVAAELPGNQARVRAIKRWVRENFPDARKRMVDMTAEWLERGKNMAAVRQVIDAEYRIIVEKGLPPGEIAEPPRAISSGQPSMPPVFRTWGDVAQLAHDCGVSQDEIFRRARVKKWADFSSFDEAAKVVQELVNERAHKPRML